jgi:hypothetical protein
MVDNKGTINRYAIDAMQSVCLKEAGVNAMDSFAEETTLIGLTFGGYLHSKVMHFLEINDIQRFNTKQFSFYFILLSFLLLTHLHLNAYFWEKFNNLVHANKICCCL